MLSSNSETSVNTLYRHLKRLLRFEGLEPERHTYAKACDVKRMRYDNRRACELLGWKPKVKLVEGLKRTVESAKCRL